MNAEPAITLTWHEWCIYCGRFQVVVWQGYCGCWEHKCLLCGDVGVSTCCEDKDHIELFEEMAERHAGL